MMSEEQADKRSTTPGLTLSVTADEEGKPKRSLASILKATILNTQGSLLALIVVIMVAMAIATDSFWTPYNLQNLFRQASIEGIIAIASTIVIITAGIDLSVGSVVGLTAMISAVLMTEVGANIGVWPAIIIAMLAGTFVGLYHGFIIYDVKVDSFIATLGSMIFVRGIIKIISGAKTTAYLPDSFTNFAQVEVFTIPSLVLVWLGVAALSHFVLKYTRFGRNIFVIGSSMEVAKLAGIRMRLNIYGVYILAAFLNSLAGVLLSSRLTSAMPTGGAAYLMPAITAAVIGGASLHGAQGSIIGSVLGTLLMTTIITAGIHLEVHPFIMESVLGALLTVAVVIDQLRQRRAA